jgi:TrmH family RNA methyltransferase
LLYPVRIGKSRSGVNAMRLLTLARDLRRRRGRERQGRFVAEGVRAVEALLAARLPVEGLLAAPSLGTTPRGTALRALAAERRIPVTDVTEAEFAGAADTESPQGVLAIAPVPARTLGDILLPAEARIVVLDGVQDPGNAGTILRTAAALGVQAVLALPGTVDLWNAKVVRSAMGALFVRPVVSCTWDELDGFRGAQEVALWGADAGGDPVEAVTVHSAPPARLALAVGNEGNGLSAGLRRRADRIVSLPIAADVESLNVAVATGILLYALRTRAD